MFVGLCPRQLPNQFNNLKFLLQSHVPWCAIPPCFIGLANGTILEWKDPGEVRRVLNTTSHSQGIIALLQCGKCLWSAHESDTVKLWNINTGEYIKELYVSSPRNLLLWRGQ